MIWSSGEGIAIAKGATVAGHQGGGQYNIFDYSPTIFLDGQEFRLV